MLPSDPQERLDGWYAFISEDRNVADHAWGWKHNIDGSFTRVVFGPLIPPPDDPAPAPIERPACAAIRFTRNGGDIIFAGRRHCDCLRSSSLVGLTKPHFDDQGFMTTLGRFVTRREARMLMDKAGIGSADPGGFRGDILFSEDLY